MTIHLPAAVRYALNRLTVAGHQAVIIGGCVRDALLHKTPEDFDIATSATPDEVKAAFAGDRTLDTGLRHGTVTLLYADKAMEITTFRVDGAYTDARRPDSVIYTRELSMDVMRRDFTINAMAYDPAIGLIDEVNGVRDLSDQLIRCVGDARTRFAEDALRVLRALRFAATLGFALEANTEAALFKTADGLKRISRERVYAELRKLILGERAGDVLRAYRAVLEIVIPGLNAIDTARYETACRAVDRCPMDLVARFAAYLLPLGEAGASGALFTLRADNRTRERVAMLIGATARPVDSLIEQRRAIAALGYDAYDQLLTVKEACGEDAAAIASARAYAVGLRAENACLTISQLAVNGADLLAAGVSPGPEVGHLLQKLFNQVIDGALPNERERLLDAIPNTL